MGERNGAPNGALRRTEALLAGGLDIPPVVGRQKNSLRLPRIALGAATPHEEKVKKPD